MALNNYVKFMRGSLAAYEALTIKNEDTLYFIKISDDETRLYWGERLISDGNDTSDTTIAALKDLIDVNIPEDISLTDGMFLGYNSETGKWEPKTQTEVTIENMGGATSTTAGSAGLVPAPAAGDESKVLTGDGKWTALTIPDITELTNTVANHTSTLNTLIGEDSDKSVRDIAANEVAKIVADADESYDTLKEISDWIKNHPEDVSEINSEIETIKELIGYTESVEEDENGEQVTIVTSKVGTLEAELAQVKQDTKIINTSVGELQTLLGYTAADETAGTEASLKAVKKINTIADALGVLEDSETGEIIITSAPVGNLNELNLYKELEGTEEQPNSLVDAINLLTEQMKWGSLDESSISN